MSHPPSSRALSLQDRLLALGLVLGGLVSRLPFLGADEGWFDEHFSIFTSAQSVGEILRAAMQEQTNPPGFYLLAHFWGLLGDASISWHRLLPALCGALVPAVTALAFRRLGFSRLAASAAGLLLLVSPVPWNMSLEIRGYAPLELLAAVALFMAAGIIADEAAPSRRTLAALSLVHVAMVLLHYFGAFAVLGISLAVADNLRRRAAGDWKLGLRTAVALGAPAALTIAAWMAASLSTSKGAALSNAAWIPVTSAFAALAGLSSVVLANMNAGIGLRMSQALLASGALLACWWAMGRGTLSAQRGPTGRFAVAVALLPIGVALLAHVVAGNDLWVPRYMAVFAPSLMLMPALVVDSTALPWRRVTAIALASWWLVAGTLRFGNRVPKPDWTDILAHLAPNGQAVICANQSFVGLPFVYHANIGKRSGVHVVNAALCRPSETLTWLVYEADATGVTAPPAISGLVLGPRIVLFRGMQNLDARRVIGRGPAGTN